MIPLGTYKHYKGQLYEVIGIGLHTETREKMVIYKALYPTPELTEEYGDEPHFIRPYTQFTKQIEIKGVVTPRFRFCHSEEQKNLEHKKSTLNEE
ncbi:MAG: DUF1653 domain-containing protein [Candidatus Gracilibacteria bacterium]|nr:DUF1653 domain-containing protein [Candidatus Gracilibacteria bacterium]